MNLAWVVGVLALAAAVTAALVEVIRRASIRLALLDHPNHRSSHDVPTPRLGGIGIAITLLGGLVLLATSVAGDADRVRLLVLVAIGAAVSALSLLDDVRSLGAALRLATHLAAGALVVRLIGAPDIWPFAAMSDALTARVLIAVCVTLWIAWFVNAFNFMDGIDGIAGLQAAVAGVSWMVLGWLGATPLLMLAGALLLGTMIGFLGHNWSPSRIFMGDAGSALLGFLLATVPWVLMPEQRWWPSLLVLWPFVFDATFTLARRLWNRERVWEAHRTHLYQRMVAGGRTHAAVSTLYGACAGAGLVACLLARMNSTWTVALAWLVVASGSGILWWRASRTSGRVADV